MGETMSDTTDHVAAIRAAERIAETGVVSAALERDTPDAETIRQGFAEIARTLLALAAELAEARRERDEARARGAAWLGGAGVVIRAGRDGESG